MANRHFCLYLSNSGMQTWEYAPQYALRTYAYLLPMAGIAKACQMLLDILPTSLLEQLPRLLMLPETSKSIATLKSTNKPLLFSILRSTLAMTSSYAELSFLHSIHDAISPHTAYTTALIQLTSAGFFHANQAYLPSSSVMILWQLSISHQFRNRHGWAIFWGLVAVLAVGWPFCAVLFVTTGSLAIWEAYTKARGSITKQSPIWAVAQVLVQTVLQAISIQAVVVAIDYHYYGRLVSPIFNIFAYNAQGGGDELYGVEPLSYYVKNIALNFNFVGLLGIVAPPMLTVKLLLRRASSRDSSKFLALLPMYLWMAIVFPRPHKEERFLFPMYPMLCFGAAVTMDEVLGLLIRNTPKNGGLESKFGLLLGVTVLAPMAVISISRSLSLHHNYTAPLTLYQDVFHHIVNSPHPANGGMHHVCTGGEWYRFPSSFFLPNNTQLSFLKSSFDGQLPQPFTHYGSRSKSLEFQSGKFNDMNEEEIDRYIDINQCSFVVEIVSITSDAAEDTPECLEYMKADSSGSWSRLSSYGYLDAESTPTIHRILYLPFGRDGKVKYKAYNLYARQNLKI